MTPTRIPTLVTIAAVFTALTWAALGGLYTALPPLPWTLVPALAIAAATEAWTARQLRARIRRGAAGATLPAIRVVRIAVLAKATAQVSALLVGFGAGFVGYLGLAGWSAPIPQRDTIVAAATIGGALVLTVAALYLEFCCRVPTRTDERRLR